MDKKDRVKKGLKKMLLLPAALILLSAAYPPQNNLVSGKAYTYGSAGDTVKNIQDKLQRWGYFTGNVDGVYGYDTWMAVTAFQYKNNLDSKGIAGAETLEALGVFTDELNGGANQRDNDIWFLASFIENQAKNESYICKVSVGAVILNRMDHHGFPNTLSGIIYQPDNSFNITEDDLSASPGRESLMAARDAINGFDPTSGATYYYQSTRENDQWLRSMPVLKKIGSYSFSLY